MFRDKPLLSLNDLGMRDPLLIPGSHFYGIRVYTLPELRNEIRAYSQYRIEKSLGHPDWATETIRLDD